jgi:hypothetical protein
MITRKFGRDRGTNGTGAVDVVAGDVTGADGDDAGADVRTVSSGTADRGAPTADGGVCVWHVARTMLSALRSASPTSGRGTGPSSA